MQQAFQVRWLTVLAVVLPLVGGPVVCWRVTPGWRTIERVGLLCAGLPVAWVAQRVVFAAAPFVAVVAPMVLPFLMLGRWQARRRHRRARYSPPISDRRHKE